MLGFYVTLINSCLGVSHYSHFKYIKPRRCVMDNILTNIYILNVHRKKAVFGDIRANQEISIFSEKSERNVSG